MRTLFALTGMTIALASCGSAPTTIVLGRCWSVSVGDRVEGPALLSAYADPCTECGSFVAASDKCQATYIAIGSDAADKSYNDLLRSSRRDSMGMIHRAVTISGIAVPQNMSTRPMISLQRVIPLDLHRPSKHTST